MKIILLTLIILIGIGSENKPKKVVPEPKVKNEIIVVERKETGKKAKSLIIPFNEYQIEFINSKDNLELMEKPEIKNDTLFIFGPDISELKSIRINSSKSDEFRITQKYESSLILQFDGKAFEMKNWKSYHSEWFDISNGEKIKSYSEKDYEKFPEYSRKDLLKALEINKKNISEHWYNFVIENLDKKESEVFFEPIINKTIFKIEIIGKRSIYVELEHMIGC